MAESLIKRHPLRFHEDDRGVRYCDIFPVVQGDVNATIVYPGALSAWHRHQLQDDYQVCVLGALKFGFADRPAKDGGRVEWVYTSERSAKDGSLFIPRRIWHGYYNFTNEPAIVLYWLTNKYNPNDEERMTVEAMGFDWLRHAK
jgi:dTDP-4-dehydrorhamnose 3,5-epimerase